jgi:hypothetical protein
VLYAVLKIIRRYMCGCGGMGITPLGHIKGTIDERSPYKQSSDKA